MTSPTADHAWRKSTRSNDAGGQCVQVTDAISGRMLVRDSKLGDTSPVLDFTATEWSMFVATVRTS